MFIPSFFHQFSMHFLVFLNTYICNVFSDKLKNKLTTTKSLWLSLCIGLRVVPVTTGELAASRRKDLSSMTYSHIKQLADSSRAGLPSRSAAARPQHFLHENRSPENTMQMSRTTTEPIRCRHVLSKVKRPPEITSMISPRSGIRGTSGAESRFT